MTGELSPADRAYYLEIEVNERRANPDRLVTLLRELANATELSRSIPELDEVSSLDTTLVALVVSRISPTSIVAALEDQPIVEALALWEVDAGALPVEVVDRSVSAPNPSDEFRRLRAAFDGGEEIDDLDSRDPERVEFSDDELSFEEVLEGEDGTTESTSGENDIDWGAKDDSVVAKLAEELERSERRDDHVETICRYLVDARPRTSVEVRLTHVQSRVDELHAYVDALEEFLDENGTAEELIEEFRAEVTRLQESVTEVREASAEAAEERAALGARVTELEESTLDRGKIEEQFATLESDVEGRFADLEGTIENRAADLRRSVDEVDALRIQERERIVQRIDSLRERQRSHDRWRERLESAFSDESSSLGTGIDTSSGP